MDILAIDSRWKNDRMMYFGTSSEASIITWDFCERGCTRGGIRSQLLYKNNRPLVRPRLLPRRTNFLE